ncbi:hypothetical protein F5148DRAFT_262342 [Russula earlei]|uniref:Uncharacterized protein n=1 Tax=Russula earlei TaxID=71964 RepID=A0ACC0UJG7_9AGAM|nr:hypothetical protein F5148DRAFT_262342 [Russula earlei]
MVSAAKQKDASDVLRRSTRSSRAKAPSEVEEDTSGAELLKSTLGQSRSKSSGKGKSKGPIEVIEEADEDGIPRAALPTKQRVRGKENVAQDTKVPRPTRTTKVIRTNDTEEEAHQPRHRLPKKGRAAFDEREESTPDVDSENDVQHAGKQYRVVESVSSREESAEEIIPKKVQALVKKTKGKTPKEPEGDQMDGTGAPSRPAKKALSKVPTKPRGKPEAIGDSNEGSGDELEDVKQTAESLPSPHPGKDKTQSRLQAPLEGLDRASSQSSEEAVVPFPSPVKRSGKGKAKGFESADITVSHHTRGGSWMTSESNSSPKSLALNGKAYAAPGAAPDVQNDIIDIDSDVASTPITPPRKTSEMAVLSENMPCMDVDSGAVAPPDGPRSPEHPAAPALRHEEIPGTPPPPSSSLLSVSSTTSMTKVEGHTDTETLVEPTPLRTNGSPLTEEERMMTVEQWIRREIEVQYEQLRRDGEMKIRSFKERAEEVRRQIEAL